TRLQPTSVGIVEWAFDPHGCHKYDPQHPGVREGYFFINHSPMQVPYGVLVPRDVDGLLVPVACSCSHVAYNALRMEPVFMALGEASGIAAHMAIRDNVAVRRVSIARLQRLLVEGGATITFYSDLPFDSPHFAAFQWLGARGLNPGYQATPDLKLTRRHGWVKLGRILEAEGRPWKAPQDAPDAPLSRRDVCRWLQEAGYQPPDDTAPEASADQPLDLSRFAELLYRTIAKE
ncbi:MAG: FAD-dependent oxidoreductase, partial [Planctomycetes bacterium]|nr:FAD-dependent oxidoreductase [Planctomycetota bacterium]